MNEGKRAIAGRVLQAIGAILVIGCLVFFLSAFSRTASSLHSIGVVPLAVTGALGLGYAFTLLLLAFGWRTLLLAGSSGRHDVALIPVFALCHFGKYIPGSFFHLAGRHAILTRAGFAQRILLASTFRENVLLVLASALVGAVMLILFPGATASRWLADAGVPIVSSSFGARAVFCVVLGATSLAAAAMPLRWFFSTRGGRVFGLYAVFFLSQGLSLGLIIYALTGSFPLEVFGVAPVAWLAGFLTPGAPGGIGVREVVLMALLGSAALQGDGALIAALFRLSNFSGDLLFFLYGLVQRRRALAGAHLGSQVQS